jgi:hypothetical protein
MIDFNALSLEIKVAILAVIAAALFAAGWSVEGWRMGGKISDLEREHAEQAAKTADESAARLSLAMARGDVLSAQLAASDTALTTLTKEKEDAIRRLTTGRPCLSSAAVGVLNRTAGLQPPALPETAGQPVSADDSLATDTDVGLWIASAQRSYDTCRGRLQAVADFYESDTYDDR